MVRISTLFGPILALLLLAACGGGPTNPLTNDGGQQARLLLWHTWSTEQAGALDAMLTAYQNLNPNVAVITLAVPAENLVSRLQNRSRAGMGPDIVLADAGQIYTLAESGLIRDLAPLNLDLSSYLSSTIEMVADSARLYGLPMAAHTHVLYYNRTMVATPPATIAELMGRIGAGEFFAQSPSFIDSYWGIGAHDGGIIDSEGHLLFGLGGFANWLDFLTEARTQPGFFLERDPLTLRQLFIDGEVAYYVGDSQELVNLVATMGAETVGVALLPTGPNGGAPRPLLQLDALAFTDVSNAREFRHALDLAEFLTGVENQFSLATIDLGLTPVNRQIRLMPNLPANALAVARQSRTSRSIPFINQPTWNDLNSGALGFVDTYEQAIQGALAPAEMIAQSLANLEERYGLRPKIVAAQDLCPAQPATVTMWHSLRFDEARVVEELAREFETICPGMALNLTYTAADKIIDGFRQVDYADNRYTDDPDMLLESSRWLAPLAEEGLLLDLTERVSADFLQQFLPETVETMRYGGRLYGVPESVEVLAMFYNPTFVAAPPIDMQQLVQNVNAADRLALPVGFFWGYWGMDPYGGFEFDSYTGAIGTTEGLVNWLTLLQATDIEAGVDLYFDDAAAEDAFAFEEAAYFVSGPWSLPRLRQELGDERFRVIPLPNGPFMAGNPMLQVVGTMISVHADELAVDAGLAFSRYLNLPANQQRLAATGNHVSASVTVDLSAYPNIEGFRAQAKSVALVVENSNFLRLEAQGDLLYQAVLIDGADSAEAVSAFVDAVHRENGVE